MKELKFAAAGIAAVWFIAAFVVGFVALGAAYPLVAAALGLTMLGGLFGLMASA